MLSPTAKGVLGPARSRLPWVYAVTSTVVGIVHLASLYSCPAKYPEASESTALYIRAVSGALALLLERAAPVSFSMTKAPATKTKA